LGEECQECQACQENESFVLTSLILQVWGGVVWDSFGVFFVVSDILYQLDAVEIEVISRKIHGCLT
jgi:hypothetical protein